MESYTEEQLELYSKLADATKRMQNGDDTAFNDIYNLMFSHVNALIQTRGVSGDDAVDVAQETMISVYKYASTIKDPQSTYKWIMSLTNNKIVDYFRKNAKRLENETSIVSEEDDMGEAEKLYNKAHDSQSGQLSIKVPEDIFVNKEKQQMILGIVNSLKEEQKQIVMMHCFSDMTFKDIAEVLGVSENTVKTKFYRSLNKLESSIYEVEKKEGVRLHSVGIVPFLLFIYMLYSKTVPVSASMMDEVTEQVGKEIKKIKKNPKNEGNPIESSNMKSGLKAATVGRKIIMIVAAVGISAGIVAAIIFAVTNSRRNDGVNNDINAATEINSEIESEAETESEIETESKDNVQELLESYYNDTLIAQYGLADKSFIRNYLFSEADEDDDMTKEYIDTTGNPGLVGKRFVDIDGDSEVEMLVGNIIQNDTVLNAQILIYDYDLSSESVSEITNGIIKSVDFGWCNDTVQFAYQSRNDGFYIYSTDIYTDTWYEGGYQNAVAYAWKIDSTRVEAVLTAENYGTTDMMDRNYMNAAKDTMPTIVKQWYGEYDQISGMVYNNFREIPLIKSLNEMDPDYTELMYIGIGRSDENSTNWEFEYDKNDIPGFIDFK